MCDLPDYVQTSRDNWDRWAPDWVEMGELAWAGEPSWGLWGILDCELQLLPEDMTGMDAIELGCGTGVSRDGWHNGEPGSSVSTTRTNSWRRRVDWPASMELGSSSSRGNAAVVPYPDASFDFAVSEYGAVIWADPYKWIPEATRLLRPGGHLVFLGNHPLISITQPRDADAHATKELLYPYFGLHRIDWDDAEESGTEFNLPISGWIRLFH
ncbi:MAG TPA: methyltransferase domain-containing protein [Acidimicrobiia bacterium]|nr:methyltransferase domain-containing protein [Acidimicrobiia bacterium]